MKFPERGSSGFLAAGGVAAILASTCCLGPLILVLLGFSGAWIGNLTVLEPYRPFFLGLALVALIPRSPSPLSTDCIMQCGRLLR